MNSTLLSQSEKVTFWIENDILFCKCNDVNCYLSEEDATAYLSAIKEITQETSLPLLIDIRNFVGNFSLEAVKMFADNPMLKTNIITQAFVADTLNSKLLIGSYIRIYAHDVQIQIFNDIETAVTYCVEAKTKFYADKL